MENRFQIKDIAPLKLLLQQPQQIVITTHFRPDGDAIGSSLGLYNYLVQKGHRVHVITPSDYPSFLKWMPGSDSVIDFLAKPELSVELLNKATLLFCLDFNRPNRLASMEKAAMQSGAVKVLIDHHPDPEQVFDHVFSFSNACATCELIYEFILALNDQSFINKAVAECLYAGIMTDTQSFRLSTMQAETHRTIAKLIERGAANHMIHERIYDTNSESRLRLLGHCLKDNLTIVPGMPVAYTWITESDSLNYVLQPGDTEGFVNYALSLDGIKVAAFFSPRDKITRISFRSKEGIPVNKLAEDYFDGGGHVQAAGGQYPFPVTDAIAEFIRVLPALKPYFE